MILEKKKKMALWKMSAIVFFSYCAAMAVSMRFALPGIYAAQHGGTLPDMLAEIVWNLGGSLSETNVTSTLFFAGFTAMGVLAYRAREEKRAPRALLPVCFLVALVWLMGAGFSIDNTLVSLDATPGQVVKSVCYVLGSTYLLYQLGQLLFWFLERDKPPELERTWKLSRLYRAHPFRVSFCAILLCWLPHLAISYPGSISYDSWFQLSQFFEIAPLTAHHPPTSTLLPGAFVQLGKKLGSGNMGLYIYILVQALMEAAIFARGLSLMKKWEVPRWLIWGSFLVIVASPYYVKFVCMALKDNQYAAGMVLFVEEMICMLEEERGYFSSWRHQLLLSASILLVLMFRHNGKYVLYPTVVALLVYFWVTREKTAWKKTMVRTVACILVPILLANGLVAVEMARYNIEKGSIAESLSLPFQQTARYVKEFGDEVTEEEASAIRAVLDYEHLAENYNPVLSDPVKSLYKGDATKEDLLNYFSVWFKQFWKHPEVYIKATANQNYFMVCPFVDNRMILPDTMVANYPLLEVTSERTGIHEVEALQGIKTVMNLFCWAMFTLPVIGLLTYPAPYNLLLIALLIFAVSKKKIKWLLISFPLMLSFLVVLLAPWTDPRYAFPIIYSMPIAIAYYIRLNSFEKVETAPGEKRKGKNAK